MCCEDLLLFFQNTCHLLLESKELLFVFATHCSLHCVDILAHFLFVLIPDYVLDLNLLLYLLVLFDAGSDSFGRRNSLFY